MSNIQLCVVRTLITSEHQLRVLGAMNHTRFDACA